ncbi:g- coupled receptor-like protein [Schistosoma japonicum]|nr:g- coupled receptor-like protein [Schistosoma japonicum]
MMQSSNLNSLIAEEEENDQKLVLQNYIPTLVVISCFLVCISIFGIIGNWLVVHTIGRHIFKRFFKLFENCLRILCYCFKYQRKRESLEQVQKCCHSQQDISQQQSNSDLKSRQSRTYSLVPVSQLSNDVSDEKVKHHDCSLTSVNNIPGVGVYQSTVNENYCTGNRKPIKPSTYGKPFVVHADLNSDLLIILLAVNDLIICLIDIPITIFLTVWETRTYDFICRLHVILKSFTLTVSALILVIIALDRWLLVCFVPCVIMTKNCVKQLIIGTYIIGLLWAIPMGLHQGVHTYFKISTVDKLVSSGSEANIVFHELNHMLNTKQSELNGNISDNSVISSKKLSLTYFSTQFFDLITSFTNYGYCKSDERFITQGDYEVYQLSILVLFTLIFSLICLFYGYLFLFILIHQYRWRKKFGPKVVIVRPTNTAENDFENDIMINQSNTKTYFNHFINCNKQRFLSIQADKINLNSHQRDRLSLDCCVSATQPINLNQPVITKDPKIVGQYKEAIFYRNNNDLQCTTGRKHVFSSVKRSNRTKLPNNRHIRSAITFILITVSFLISYLPSLLIANGFIWPVKWELSTGTTDEFTYIYNNNTINITNSLLSNEHLIDNLKSTVITSNNQRLLNQTNDILPIYKHNVASKIIIIYHLRRLFHFLYFINSTANPLIYFFFNLKFRLQLKYLINCLSTCFTNQNSI